MAAPRRSIAVKISRQGPGAVALLDEAVSLLRHTPLDVLAVYYLGAAPFSLALIYFYFDLTQSADAQLHLVRDALILTVAYLGLKVAQAAFASRLIEQLEGREPEPWGVRGWANTVLLQIIYAGTWVIIYPVAFFIALPFGWVAAFYHNVSLVASGPRATLASSWRECLELSRLWPRQNHIILLVLFAGALILFGNLAVVCITIPALLEIFFGIDTVFQENMSAWNNGSFYLDVAVFCFLLLNPLSTAAYALRCFYGRARFSGADLRAGLRRQAITRRQADPVRALAVVLMLALATPVVHADERASPSTPPSQTSAAAPASAKVSQLDRAIQTTLAKDEFAWRMPRTETAKPAADNFFTRILRSISDFTHQVLHKISKPFGKLLRWLLRSDRQPHSAGGGWSMVEAIPWRVVFIGVLAILVMAVVGLLVRHFRGRAAAPRIAQLATPVKSVDLESESVRADELPEDSWLALAQQLMEGGDLRLALRALYLATLSVLARAELVRLAATKSNRDYLLEMTRRLRGDAAAVQFFRDNIRLFEASWYGTHAVTRAMLDAMLSNHHQVRTHAAP